MKDGICNSHFQPIGTVNGGIITVHEYNATLFLECMAMSLSDCIQAQFANGCNIRMTQLDRKLP